MKQFFITLYVVLMSVQVADAASFKLVSGMSETSVTTENLEKLPQAVIRTSTNFTPRAEFQGVPFSELVAKYNIESPELRFFALDDYSYTIPIRELIKYHAILAYKKNGALIPVSDLGPFVVIYPLDSHPELSRSDINAKTVWQIDKVEGTQ
ncbi:oxidoreductase [Pantoea ananatis]|nr:oxidoreductase [Pantoea ananatis]